MTASETPPAEDEARAQEPASGEPPEASARSSSRRDERSRPAKDEEPADRTSEAPRRHRRRHHRKRIRMPSGMLSTTAYGPLAIAGLGVPLFAIGAVNYPTLLASLAVVAIWALWSLALDAPQPSGKRFQLARLGMWTVVGVCALQLVPLAPSLLARLSPEVSDIWRSTDVALGGAPGKHPLTLDPPATSFAFATSLCAALAFEATARAVCGRTRHHVLYILLAGVVLFDGIALAQGLLGLDKVYGYYQPKDVSFAGILRPVLLNVNHAAAVSAIGPALATGLAIEEQERPAVRWIWFLIAAATAVATLLFMSRSGIIVVAFEVFAFAMLMGWRAPSTAARFARIGTGLVSVLALAAVAIYVGKERFTKEATDTDLSKLHIPRLAFDMARENWRFGVGHDAFGSSFTRWSGHLPQDTRFTHVESWPAQLLVDMGAPIGTFVALCFGVAVLGTLTHAWRKPALFGALVALVGLAAHDVVDFSMAFAGVGGLAAALLAVVVTENGRSSPIAARGGQVVVALAAVGLGAKLLHGTWDQDVLADAKRAYEAARERKPQADLVVMQAMRRHPGDPGFPVALSGLMPARRAALLIHAVKLAPNSAYVHLGLARYFLAMGYRSQAFAEYRAAMDAHPPLTGTVLAELVQSRASLDELIVSASSAGRMELVTTYLLGAKRFEDAQAFDDLTIESYPPAISARVRGIDRALAAKDLELARKRAADLVQAAPDAAESYVALARVAPDSLAAESAISNGVAHAPQNVALRLELMRLRAVRLGATAVGKEANEVRDLLNRSGEDSSIVEATLADVELEAKHPAAALKLFLEAADVSIAPVPLIAKAASIAETIGDGAFAAILYDRLTRIDPENAEWPKARERARASVAPTRRLP